MNNRRSVCEARATCVSRSGSPYRFRVPPVAVPAALRREWPGEALDAPRAGRPESSPSNSRFPAYDTSITGSHPAWIQPVAAEDPPARVSTVLKPVVGYQTAHCVAQTI
jgi:hypothetical protein